MTYPLKKPIRQEMLNKALSLLKKQPMTYRQLAQSMNVHVGTASSYIKDLKELSLVYISGYDHTGGNPVKYYKAGNKPDMAIPPKRKLEYNDKPTTPPVYVVPKIIQPDIHSAWLVNLKKKNTNKSA